MTTQLDGLAKRVLRLHEALEPWSHSTSVGTSWLPLVRHPPLDPTIVNQLADAEGVTLPSDYRHFLSSVGNGGVGPTRYPLFTLAFALAHSGPLQQRFELHGPVSAVESAHRARARRQLENFGALDLADLRSVDVDDEPALVILRSMPGCLHIGESGCGLDFFLVVDARSSCFGQVWLSCDFGTACVGRDFLSWYAGQTPWATEGMARRAGSPMPELVVDRACEAMDLWVGLVQRCVFRSHGRDPTADSVYRDFVRSMADGPLLRWERSYAARCFAAAHAIAGDHRQLLAAKAWSEVLLSIGDPAQTLSPLGLSPRPVLDQLCELTDLERWTYADREAYLDEQALHAGSKPGTT